MLARESYVALVGEQLADFSDEGADGYIDMHRRRRSRPGM